MKLLRKLLAQLTQVILNVWNHAIRLGGFLQKNNKQDVKVLIGRIRDVCPNIIAQDLLSVQPMIGPASEIFTLRPPPLLIQWGLEETYHIQKSAPKTFNG